MLSLWWKHKQGIQKPAGWVDFWHSAAATHQRLWSSLPAVVTLMWMEVNCHRVKRPTSPVHDMGGWVGGIKSAKDHLPHMLAAMSMEGVLGTSSAKELVLLAINGWERGRKTQIKSQRLSSSPLSWSFPGKFLAVNHSTWSEWWTS